MNLGLLIYIVIFVLITLGLILLLIKVNSPKNRKSNSKSASNPFDESADKIVKTIFDDRFKEELRNRGLLHFEKIINENAMFMQQDLRLITADLNDYMRREINNKLSEEFRNYTRSIDDAKQLAIQSINKTQLVLERERVELTSEVKLQLERNKDLMIKNLTEHMADIINHYILQAIGNQIDLTDQLEFILADLNDNKDAIIEDLKYGT